VNVVASLLQRRRRCRRRLRQQEQQRPLDKDSPPNRTFTSRVFFTRSLAFGVSCSLVDVDVGVVGVVVADVAVVVDDVDVTLSYCSHFCCAGVIAVIATVVPSVYVHTNSYH